MTTFGYPPGYYVRKGDPTNKERMRRRIKGDAHSDWNATSLLLISDDDNIAPAPQGEAPELPPPPPTSAPETIWLRSVHFPTSYFDSNALPCCWPLQLPPLPGEEPAPPAPVRRAPYQAKESRQISSKIPPWRLPRAFDFSTPPTARSALQRQPAINPRDAATGSRYQSKADIGQHETEEKMDLDSD